MSIGYLPPVPRTGFQDTLWAIEPTLFATPTLPGSLDVDLSSMLKARASSDAIAKKAAQVKEIDPTTRLGSVAVIDVAGPLTNSPGMFRILGCSDAATLPEIQKAIRRAADDAKVSSILLRVASPGGTVFGTPEVADEVFRAREKKMVVAHVESMAASAAMWIASQATEVVAGRVAHLGSIGVYGVLEDWSEHAKGVGVKIHAIRSTKLKGAGVRGTEISKEMLAEIQGQVAACAELFVDDLARGFGIAKDQAKGLHDGRLFVGHQGVDRGLANRIDSLESTLSVLFAQGVKGSAPSAAALRARLRQSSRKW